ncbi:MAG: hypothetical protein H0T75_14185, partial [Rhizobiales bacterium]|nr:hypothetical protein [Hyphomicrobiales bacterium]
MAAALALVLAIFSARFPDDAAAFVAIQSPVASSPAAGIMQTAMPDELEAAARLPRPRPGAKSVKEATVAPSVDAAA